MTSLSLIRLRPEIARKLAYYVYALIDPRTDEIFYVGKGCRCRVLAHLDDKRESEKTRRIAEIRDAGGEPKLDIIAHGMTDEETAFRVEAALIDVLRPGERLTNRVRGFRALQFGRAPLSELELLYAARTITITEPALLIRINRLYRPGMGEQALYEATRGIWKIGGSGSRRDSVRYAFAVYEGVVRQVYAVESWHPAGTTPYLTRPDMATTTRKERWEFTGSVSLRLARKYNGGSVGHHFPRYSQTPFTYVNC